MKYEELYKKLDQVVMPFLTKDFKIEIELVQNNDIEETVLTKTYYKNKEIFVLIYHKNNNSFELITNKNINNIPYELTSVVFTAIEDIKDEVFKYFNNIAPGTKVFDQRVEIIIPIDPRTKKNSSRIGKKKTKNGKTARFLLASEAFENYQNQAGYFLKPLKINKRVNIKCLYFMKTRRKVDLNNLHSAIHDVLVHYNVLTDDNSKIIVTTNGSKVLYDKENPRTEISIKLI